MFYVRMQYTGEQRDWDLFKKHFITYYTSQNVSGKASCPYDRYLKFLPVCTCPMLRTTWHLLSVTIGSHLGLHSCPCGTYYICSGLNDSNLLASATNYVDSMYASLGTCQELFAAGST